MPAEVADALDVGSNGTDPMILRAALINAHRCIAALATRLSAVEKVLHAHGWHP